MSDERNDGVPPWRDPPPGALDLIRAAREAPRMTKEEEDLSVQDALAAVAAMEKEARAAPAPRPWWRRHGPRFAAGAIAASIVLWLWMRPAQEERETAKGPPLKSSAVDRTGPGPLRGTESATPTAGPEKDAGPDGAR